MPTVTPGGVTLTLTGSAPWIPLGLNAIPASATVFSLVGLNFNLYDYMPPQLQARFSTAPYTMHKVNYPASTKTTSITEGVAALNSAVRNTAGSKIVIAHSQGAQVCSRWMRTYANDGTAPPASELMFILTGNPLRSTGGYIIGRPEIGGTTGLPTPLDTKWRIVDVARRYDGWADWVHNQSNALAVNNAKQGQFINHGDPAYNSVNLYASTNTVWTSGNTTYVLTSENPPLLRNYLIPAGAYSQIKKHIESAYNRPANDPAVTVIAERSWLWRLILSILGITPV